MLLAIIPAKKQSRRLPGKNFRLINGVSLVERARRVAEEAKIFDHIHVATDENRHAYICDDQVQTAAVVFDTLCKLNYAYDEFCVLNPTTPTRTVEMVQEGYRLFHGHVSCLPSMMNGEEHDGAFLFWRTLDFLRFISRSIILSCVFGNTNCIDINDQEDFDRAEKILIEREGRHV